ncbi:MAG: hypothetical protein AAFX50_19230 [Acidobacteriota bacterium]
MIRARVASVVDLRGGSGAPAWLLLFVAADAPSSGAEEVARDVWYLTPDGARIAATKAGALGIQISGFEQLDALDPEMLVGRECRLELHRPPSAAHPRLLARGAMAPNYYGDNHGYHPPLDVDQGVPAGEADLLAATVDTAP